MSNYSQDSKDGESRHKYNPNAHLIIRSFFQHLDFVDLVNWVKDVRPVILTFPKTLGDYSFSVFFTAFQGRDKKQVSIII